MLAECDVLAPCALGGAIARQRRPAALRDRLRRPPTTSSPTTGSRSASAERGILFAPDFIANAGGLMNVSMEISVYRDLP